MVFSATKGMASTVIHRLADRGLIDYDAPVAEYWPAFGANGKSAVTVRDLMRHRAGLSQLNRATKADLMDHLLMEERMAAAPMGWMRGRPAYHALTYGWLMSGLARAVTGRACGSCSAPNSPNRSTPTASTSVGRRSARRRSPLRSSGRRAALQNPIFNLVAPHLAALPFSGGFGSMYFPGMKAMVQGDTPLLDTELPAANGVATARALARMYGAIANGGTIDGNQFLSAELVAGLTGPRSLHPDGSIFMPMSFHLGYHGLPLPGILPGIRARRPRRLAWVGPIRTAAWRSGSCTTAC